MTSRQELSSYLNTFLQIQEIEDYGPNGLQVKGKDQIKKMVFAVSASHEAINEAVKLQADALCVHHGIFWKNLSLKARPVHMPL